MATPEPAKRSRDYRPDRPTVAEIAAGGVVQHPVEPCVLLLHEVNEDRWCLPKGHVEEGESLGAAALREVAEETGLKEVAVVEDLGEVTYRFFQPSQDRNILKVVTYFLMRSSTDGLPSGPVQDHALTFDRAEWVSLGEARTRVPYASDLEVLRRVGPRLEASTR